MKSGEQQDGRDGKVVGAYRAASDALDERPSAAARAAILAAAARAVDAQPRDAQTGATARRAQARTTNGGVLSKRPLAAAASFLVATVALVVATNVEREPADTVPNATSVPAPTEAARVQHKVEQPATVASADAIAPAAQPSEATRANPALDRAVAEHDAARNVDATPRAKALRTPDAGIAATSDSVAQRRAAPAASPAATPAPAPEAMRRLAPAPAAPAGESKLMERRELATTTPGGASANYAMPPPEAIVQSSPAAKADAQAAVPSIVAVTPAEPPAAALAVPGKPAAAPPAPSASPGQSTLGALSSPRAPAASGAAANRAISEAEMRARQDAQAGRSAADRATPLARESLEKAVPAKVSEATDPSNDARARQFAGTRPLDRSIALERDVDGDPARWAQRIAALRDAGLDADADRELARLRERYPAFEVPANALRRAGTR